MKALGKGVGVVITKICQVRQMIDEIHPSCNPEVGGGIDATTAPLVVNAGANVPVVGDFRRRRKYHQGNSANSQRGFNSRHTD